MLLTTFVAPQSPKVAKSLSFQHFFCPKRSDQGSLGTACNIEESTSPFGHANPPTSSFSYGHFLSLLTTSPKKLSPSHDSDGQFQISDIKSRQESTRRRIDEGS